MTGPGHAFVCGGMAGTAGIVVSQPLDVVRIRLQTSLRHAQIGSEGQRCSHGVISCVTGILRTEGVRGLYKGIAAPVATSGMRTAIVFLSYDVALKSMGTSSSSARPRQLALAGLCSALVAAPLTTVSEHIKIRAQTSRPINTASVVGLEWDIFKNIWRREGLRGLACGAQLTAMREGAYRSIYFSSYEVLARMMAGDREQRPAWVSLWAGGLAGMAPWAITYPIDVLKTHWQSERRFGATTIFSMLRNGLALEGPGWLGRGLSPTLMRAVIMNAAVWSIYEQLRGFSFQKST